MDFDKVLKSRRCTRKYSVKRVAFSDLVAVCEAARLTPMAGNIYTIRLIVVSDKQKKQELSEAALGQDFIALTPYILVICSDLTNAIGSYGERARIYARQQAGAAIENMFLKATSLGLATCWVGAFDENAVKRALQMPDKIQVEALLPIAQPFGKEKAKLKPELKLILHFERWGQRTVKPEKKPSP